MEVVLPERLRAQSAEPPLYAPARHLAAETAEKLELLRAAIKGRRKLALTYDSIPGERTERTVHPLCLFVWGAVWTFAAWCTLREGFRHFRVDRVAEACMSEEQFEEVEGRTLEDFFRHVAEEDGARMAARLGEAAEGESGRGCRPRPCGLGRGRQLAGSHAGQRREHGRRAGYQGRCWRGLSIAEGKFYNLQLRKISHQKKTLNPPF